MIIKLAWCYIYM